MTGPLMIPVSPGELIDKITILEIKAERIRDPEKLANVNRELGLLRAVRAREIAGSDDLFHLELGLDAVNRTLWCIEDDIRACEEAKEFGVCFVRWARSIHRTNDERAAIKKRIDLLLGSDITEEKSYSNEGPGG